MTRSHWLNARWWLWASASAGALVLVACGEDDGKTPSCPDLALYDIHNPSPDDVAARAAAEAKGCVTGAGDASTGSAGGGGTGGGAGVGGSAGSGGGTAATGGAGATGGASDAASD
jgi:hypothetical protein